MNFYDEYRSKLVTPEEAVSIVKDGDWVDYGASIGFPELLDAALAARKGELKDVKVRGLVELSPIRIAEDDPEQESFTYHSFMMSKYERTLCDRGLCYQIPILFRNLPKCYRQYLHPNVAMLRVTPMDKHGYFNFSMTNVASRAMIEAADYVILEIDENLPSCYGIEQIVHISEVQKVVEGPHSRLPEPPLTECTDVERRIADYIIPLIPNGATLQLGIGSLPDEIGRQIAQSDLRDLGIHSEVLCSSFYDMYEKGKITNCNRTGIFKERTVFGFGSGSRKVFEWVDENPSMLSCPMDYVNNTRIISEIDKFISINNCISVDFTGQINAESVGMRKISGTGGQLDFLTGSFDNPNGKGFIALTSSYTDRQGIRHSRIVPALQEGEIVTDPRSQANRIVTEYGMVTLMGLSVWQRAEALIGIAHPDFREELIKDAERVGVWRRSNRR